MLVKRMGLIKDWTRNESSGSYDLMPSTVFKIVPSGILFDKRGLRAAAAPSGQTYTTLHKICVSRRACAYFVIIAMRMMVMMTVTMQMVAMSAGATFTCVMFS